MIVHALLFACHADRLTRETRADQIHGRFLETTQRGEVGIPGNVGPVLGKDLTTKRIDLALPRNRHACSLQAEIEAADPRRQ